MLAISFCHAYHGKYSSSSLRIGGPLAIYDAKHPIYSSSLLISRLCFTYSEPLTMFLLCPSRRWEGRAEGGGTCLPAPGKRTRGCYLQYLKSSHFNIHVFVYPGKCSSNSPPKCPLGVPAKDYSCLWKWFLSRYMHPAAACSSPRAACLTPPCTARSVSPALFCRRDGGTWFHDISGRRINSSVVIAEKNPPLCCI